MTPTALTIAGSDSSGGAGVQADLETFAAHDVDGICAVTAVTAQNPGGVTALHAIPPEVVTAQIAAGAVEREISAVKTGMLANRAIVEAVIDAVRAHGLRRLVVDPVITATSGGRLLDDDGVDALLRGLLPLSACVTPNRAEAERLSGRVVDGLDDARDAARRILDLGPRAVVITGGHFPSQDAVDILFDGDQLIEMRHPRLTSRATHGTGCRFSAAIAAHLARGRSLPDAVQRAKDYVTGTIRRAPRVDVATGSTGAS